MTPIIVIIFIIIIIIITIINNVIMLMFISISPVMIDLAMCTASQLDDAVATA